MKRKLIIKSFRVSAKSNDTISKIIVVSFNTTRVNGYYIEKLGVISKHKGEFLYFLNLSRIGLWVNRGAIIKSKISWIIGVLGNNFFKHVSKKK